MDISIDRPEIQLAMVDHLIHEGIKGPVVKIFGVGGQKEGNFRDDINIAFTYGGNLI